MSEIKVLENGNVLVTVPISLRFCSGRRRVVFPENDTVEVDPLVMNITRAFRWQKLIDSRFSPDKWQALTKGEASQIITELYGTEDIPASDAQKKKLADLIHRGFRKGLKHKTFVNLTSSMAKSMIWHAVQAEKAGQTIEGFVPRTKLPPYAPATERQAELYYRIFLKSSFHMQIFKSSS